MGHYQIDSSDTGVYPMGLTRIEGGIHVSVAAAAKECSLLLFAPEAAHSRRKAERREKARIPFPAEGRLGDVWEMTLRGDGLDACEYAFEADGVRFADPCGHSYRGREQWGRTEQVHILPTVPVSQETFDWEGDRPLHIPYEDCVIYRAHVRGLTKHVSSGVENRGTFAGIVEKIPYLKELGITTLELLPSAEFQEVMMPEQMEGNPYGKSEPTGKINYWGYTAAYYYAPKASYAGKGKDPVIEFKKMVKALHQAGLELVAELYFTGKESPSFVLDVVRFWVREFHVDGVHLTGDAPGWIMARDPYLTDTKLWAGSWEGVTTGPVSAFDPAGAVRPTGAADGPARQVAAAAARPKHLGEYNDGFQIDMRRALKGDEEQMNNLVFRNRRNPAGWGVINYMAGTNGFTLMDMVSYEQKHNEANGENNRDGNDYNYSWNCGAEGPVRKKKLLELRKKQLRNAILMVFLSQGTPLILAGDEFGNSQGGNNNAYCQDNETSWLNWNQTKSHGDLLEFVKYVIAFRKAHPVFHMEREPRIMDYLACGHPDISYHGVNAWRPEFENFRRQIGILYCGEYGKRADGTPDDYFFVTYNMHWEPHEFALPNLPKGQIWMLAFDTGDSGANGFYPSGKELSLESQKKYMVPPRSVMVFIGKTAEA